MLLVNLFNIYNFSYVQHWGMPRIKPGLLDPKLLTLPLGLCYAAPPPIGAVVLVMHLWDTGVSCDCQFASWHYSALSYRFE